jgi:hypothetical protein
LKKCWRKSIIEKVVVVGLLSDSDSSGGAIPNSLVRLFEINFHEKGAAVEEEPSQTQN